MRVRAIDANRDWLFGKGQNDYKQNIDAVTQNIGTRVRSFLNDCFFAITDGIDWYNLLGGKNQLALNLAISATIANTENVTAILQVSAVLNAARNLTISYQVFTSYSTLPISGQVIQTLPVTG